MSSIETPSRNTSARLIGGLLVSGMIQLFVGWRGGTLSNLIMGAGLFCAAVGASQIEGAICHTSGQCSANHRYVADAGDVSGGIAAMTHDDSFKRTPLAGIT